MNNSKTIQKDAKKRFFKSGCSGSLFYIINREFGSPKENEERATDPLMGGIIQRGHQCGMLWGSALAVGAESFRRCKEREQAIGLAITVTQCLIDSFSKRAKSVNCRDISRCDWRNIFSVVKYFITGRPIYCLNLAKKWAPEAIRAAIEGLSQQPTNVSQTAISCASEVAKKMGASDEEMVMVAGFAGGIGLSGNACGALGAALWMKTLVRYRNGNPTFFASPEAKNTLQAFCGATDSEFLCNKICGQSFKTIDDHTEFIKNGGCDTLMNVLARS